MSNDVCSIPECESKTLARGWCSRHWQRWQRNGHPLAGGIDRPRVEPTTRFWSKVEKTDTCWVWAGTMNDSGYGLFPFEGKNERAHRFAWALLVGEIEDGKQIDHRCRNRACVRPEHLRVVTNKQNQEHISKRSTNTSGYRGVTFNKRKNKWAVLVGHEGRNHFGGNFDDVHEAGASAKALRNELFTHNDLDRKNAA
jgi:hypothetical protein